jgi:aminodeoxyfutalosine deaminase
LVRTQLQSVLARGVLPRASRISELLCDARLELSQGTVRSLTPSQGSSGSDAELDLSDCVLVPGLVNAHAHLELSGMLGALPGHLGFGPWVRALMEDRAGRTLGSMTADAQRGLAASLACGVTTIGDIASTDAMETMIRSEPLPRVRLYREAIDAWDSDRTQAALDRLARPWPAGLDRGFSPHAPFTVSRALLRGIAHMDGASQIMMHWSETSAEVEWLTQGSGVWAERLGPSPLTTGLELLAEAGLLTPRTTLVHGNVPQPGELERIARAGASLVHCPGTHAFFGREPFPFHAVRALGINLAIGTDSLASNDTLDMRLELRRLQACYPELSAMELLAMGTTAGAKALGYVGQIGALEPGYSADAVALETRAATAKEVAHEWITGTAAIRGVLLAGEWIPREALGAQVH